MQNILGYCCLLLLLGSINSCSDPNKMPLAGHYYTTYSEDGDPLLYFDDPQLGPTKLGYTSAVGVAKGYVITVSDSCYILPLHAATAEAARNGQIGPLTEAACEQKVLELTGDSLRLKSLLDI